MSHELVLRQKAIRWKQAGRCVSWICQRLDHSREWFYKWWNRYQEEGANGLRDRSHAPQSNPHRWSGEMHQAILDMSDRRMRRRGPRERYRLAGAATVQPHYFRWLQVVAVTQQQDYFIPDLLVAIWKEIIQYLLKVFPAWVRVLPAIG